MIIELYGNIICDQIMQTPDISKNKCYCKNLGQIKTKWVVG